MRIADKPAARLKELGVELRQGVALGDLTSLGIGGTTDQLLLRNYQTIPDVIRLLGEENIPQRFLGSGTNILVADGELPWVILHLPSVTPGMNVEGNCARVDASADLGGMVTFCAKRDLGGMEGLIGVPGSVGGALRMNAGAYGTQIGTYVREVELYRAASGQLETLRGDDIRFDYRHTSFAPDDIMLRVKLELPSKPFKEILAGIRVCNEKRRASQPLNQKSAGCIFKNPQGGSAGRMIDELGLKGHRVGDAMVSDRHANFFVNTGNASCADMLHLIDHVRERVRVAFGVELENEVIFWAKLKTIEPEVYPQEVLADEEPKYLRRQKPLEIKRRKFGRKAWKAYLQTGAWVLAGFAGVWFVWESSAFLLNARQMALIHPEQVRITGAHYVPRASILEIFAADRDRSVLRIPLAERRLQIESVPWVEQALVRRALPNTIEVEITERKPIAFLRQGNEMALIDAHGVILDRPFEGNFHFPVVTGLSQDMPADDREKRMQLFSGFTQQIASARASALDQVSEVDLTDASDVKATMTGLQTISAGTSTADAASGGQVDVPILVHFGDNDFEGKYDTLIENIGAWRATTGRVESVDLRFSREAIVNADTVPSAAKRAQASSLSARHMVAKHQGA